MWPEFRSQCPVSSALDIVGDKWSLVVLRTIFAGRHRYGELADIPEGIATNVLAERLERLERYGLVAKSAYRRNPLRYQYWLTRKGADLLPVLQALAAWAGRHIPERWPPPPWFEQGKPDQFYPAETGGSIAGPPPQKPPGPVRRAKGGASSQRKRQGK